MEASHFLPRLVLECDFHAGKLRVRQGRQWEGDSKEGVESCGQAGKFGQVEGLETGDSTRLFRRARVVAVMGLHTRPSPSGEA